MKRAIIQAIALTFGLLVVCFALPAHVLAQWADYPSAGIPRTANGKPNLSAPAPKTSSGKASIAGIWQRIAPKTPPRPAGTPNNLIDWLVPGSEIRMQPW